MLTVRGVTSTASITAIASVTLNNCDTSGSLIRRRILDRYEAGVNDGIMLLMSGPHFGRFDPTPRAVKLLREVIDALRLVGMLLAIGGVVVTSRIINLSDPITPRVAGVTGLVTVPGILYVIGSIGLARRRYWAWVMSLSVTVLLIVALLASMLVIACTHPNGTQIFCPGVFYLLMPALILTYMLHTLPVLREAELLGVKGFMILPVAPHTGDDGTSPPVT